VEVHLPQRPGLDPWLMHGQHEVGQAAMFGAEQLAPCLFTGENRPHEALAQ
jgi:hypothetical protein